SKASRTCGIFSTESTSNSRISMTPLMFHFSAPPIRSQCTNDGIYPPVSKSRGDCCPDRLYTGIVERDYLTTLRLGACFSQILKFVTEDEHFLTPFPN